MLHFIDFEVFKYDWLCVIISPVTNEETVIVNDRDALQRFYDTHKDEIYVGYNMRQYDQYIYKAILAGLDPKRVNDRLIIDDAKGFEISSLFNKIPLNYFDAMTSMHGLKTLEAFMGHNIHETGVRFDIDRKLTKAEIEETIKYCRNDVEETITIFTKRYGEFEAIYSLLLAFNLPLKFISKTKAQLSAIILDCERVDRDDEWDLYTVDTLRLSKYSSARDWFLDKNNHDYKNELIVTVAGVEHKLAWGGIHGAKPNYHGKGLFLHVDVASFYPALMIEYALLSRNVKRPEKFREIRDKRLEYKRTGNPLQAPYKIVINGTYGICKDKYSAAYDPRNANLVCINGQLLLLDLIEKMELKIPSFELIQSNTDGLIIKIDPRDRAITDAVKAEWETRTKMELEVDEIDEIWQKDVNNYIFRFSSGKKAGQYERKGAWAKKNSELDNDMPIINEALVAYFTDGTLPSITIRKCTELAKFQKIVKVSSLYKYGWHNGEYLNDKTYRVFASKDQSDSYIGKQKTDGATIEKFGNTPDKCFIENGDITNKPIPEKLDLVYYINLASERISAFC